MSKYFILNPKKSNLSKDEIFSIEKEKEVRFNNHKLSQEDIAKIEMGETDTIKHVDGRVIVKIDMEGKNYHRFDSGLTIRRERAFNNFNFRETSPVNGIVISSEHIPKGVDVIVDYHSVHDSNRIFNYKNKSTNIRYYSIKTEDCYLWYDKNGWNPLPPYELGLRLFKKYDSVISWMKPEKMDNFLYITTGKLKGKVVMTLIGCDYECVFQDTNGKEGNRVRFLPFGNEKLNKEPEAVAIREDILAEIKKEKILLGYSLSDCKTLKEWQK